MMWLTSLALARVDTATHDGKQVGDRIEWTSTFHGDRVCVPVGATDEVRFGQRQGGQACGLKSVVLGRRQVMNDTLDPPFVSEGVHRVTVRGLDFKPAPGLDLTRTVGGWSSPDVNKLDRVAFNARVKRHGSRRLRRAVYLRAPLDPIPIHVGGGVGIVSKAMMGGTLVGVLLFGLVLYRSLDGWERKERVQKWESDTEVKDELTRNGIR